jgi:hypothetical protein
MINLKYVFFLFLLIIGAGIAVGQNFEVGDIDLSSSGWGRQSVTVNLRNISEDYKWIAVQTEVIFSDTLLSPRRNSQKSVFIEPNENRKLTLPYDFPGNYGKGMVRISLYEQVDTLDPLYESLRFFKKDIPVNFPVPDSLKELVAAGINVPMYSERTELFDNLFNRLMLILLYQGRTLDDVARLTGADSIFVNMMLRKFILDGLISQDNYIYTPKFAVIESSFIDKIRPLMDSTITSLYNSIKSGLPRYDSLVSDYVATGKLSRDKYNLYEPGSVLYHKYPTTLGLLFWNKLGRDFINDGKPLSLFVGSDPCSARMLGFTFMTTGNKKNLGRSLYLNLDEGNDEGKFYCSADSVIFNCYRLSPPGATNVAYDWNVSEKNPMMYFTYEDEVIKDALGILAGDSPQIINKLKTRIETELAGSKNVSHLLGVRYWCWNLIVTEAIKKLEVDNVLAKEGSGLYLFERMK